mmetsp:Transcript_24821/g.52901  ORF Transcript_24821/g.52901 Transcript_24821/m.52901 type:complete len:254 (+) Transcript_24821:321-1082(+)
MAFHMDQTVLQISTGECNNGSLPIPAQRVAEQVARSLRRRNAALQKGILRRRPSQKVQQHRLAVRRRAGGQYLVAILLAEIAVDDGLAVPGQLAEPAEEVRRESLGVNVPVITCIIPHQQMKPGSGGERAGHRGYPRVPLNHDVVQRRRVVRLPLELVRARPAVHPQIVQGHRQVLALRVPRREEPRPPDRVDRRILQDRSVVRGGPRQPPQHLRLPHEVLEHHRRHLQEVLLDASRPGNGAPRPRVKAVTRP